MRFKLYLLFLSTLTIISCGEDRTPEYESLTACDHWMTEVMKDNYLWGDSIKEESIAWKSFFSEPKSFFSTLTKFAPVSDTWSWCSIDTLQEDYHERGYFNHINSYGLDFLLMTDPTGATSRQYARVKTVISGSPADRAGIERGDFIGMVDGNRMTSSYTSYLINGVARTLVVSKLGVNADEGEFYWTSEDTLSMERSEYVEDTPFPVVAHYTVGSVSVAYMMCNRLTAGPVEHDTDSRQYVDVMKSKIKEVRSYAPQVLILDLRLCNDGQMDMANLLASCLAGSEASGRVFAQTLYRNSMSDKNTVYKFTQPSTDEAVQPETIYVITGAYTLGAAEWLVRALSSALGENRVVVVGQPTGGQIVLTEPISSDYFVTLYPAVAYVADENGDYDYADGIQPDIELNELSYVKLYPYGNRNEIVLANILNVIQENE